MMLTHEVRELLLNISWGCLLSTPVIYWLAVLFITVKPFILKNKK